ncbi:MAG: hypothetical protein A4E71_02824 [Smithella sp. PtaU1.Bin162]|nr:MAG: hypothetical protein A4E71_02824 [Smithella sp. PtaU1.Bin162]
MNNKEFYHQDILRIFPDIRPRTLISWGEKGLIKPLREAENRGGKRIYSYNNLIEIAFVRELFGYELPFKYVQSLMERGKPMTLKEIFKKEKYDTICFISYRMERTVDFATLKAGRFPREVKCFPINNFKLEDITKYESGIIINISALRKFVDKSIA